jgi:ribosomal protein S18 acetylase RimI-like enzyme
MALRAVLSGNAAIERRLQEAPAPRIVDLREVSARDLGPLLREETVEWARELDWDFSKSAGLLRRLAEARKLGGVALLDHGEVAGFAYCGFDDHKGHIGEVYVRPRWRNGNAEASLFRFLLNALMETPGVQRIESQLMLAQAMEPLAGDRGLRSFERILMMLDLKTPLAPGKVTTKAATTARFRFEPWEDRHHEAAATTLWLSHVGHVDAQISDQYRTLAATSRFVRDLVRFPGCASFCPPASFIACDTATGQTAGISLASFVAEGVAHIAELCVTPPFRGAGLGFELLRQSAAALAVAGAKRLSLTVTAGNEEAIGLYTRCGFREMRRFYAYAWDR